MPAIYILNYYILRFRVKRTDDTASVDNKLRLLIIYFKRQ